MHSYHPKSMQSRLYNFVSLLFLDNLKWTVSVSWVKKPEGTIVFMWFLKYMHTLGFSLEFAIYFAVAVLRQVAVCILRCRVLELWPGRDACHHFLYQRCLMQLQGRCFHFVYLLLAYILWITLF